MNAPFAWLSDRRAKAARTFGTIGVPNRRMEPWKYTDPHALVSADDVRQAKPLSWSVSDIPAGVEIFDFASPEPPPGWVVKNFASQLLASEFGTASLAFATAGVAFRVSREVAGTVHLNFHSVGQALALVVLEEGASMTLIERVESVPGFLNIGMEILLAANASLAHVRDLPTSGDTTRVFSLTASVAAGAQYRAHIADFGGKLSRSDLYVRLEGEGAATQLSGVGVLKGLHTDVTTHVEHRQGSTQSTQLFKYIATGHARGVYQGKVTVAHGANGSDSRQTAKGLLLEDRAEIDLKPELEILADDVKCAHGAAVGDLDAESLFYLNSRGIPEAEARALLMRAFIGDAVDQIEDETIRAAVWQAVDGALETLS